MIFFTLFCVRDSDWNREFERRKKNWDRKKLGSNLAWNLLSLSIFIYYFSVGNHNVHTNHCDILNGMHRYTKWTQYFSVCVFALTKWNQIKSIWKEAKKIEWNQIKNQLNLICSSVRVIGLLNLYNIWTKWKWYWIQKKMINEWDQNVTDMIINFLATCPSHQKKDDIK